jgi:hypothetical protein
MMQKNVIFILPVFIFLILSSLGYAAWKDGQRLNYGKSWTPVPFSTLLPAQNTSTPGWWAVLPTHPVVPNFPDIATATQPTNK